MSQSTTTSKKEMIHIESCERDDRGTINYKVGYSGGGVREWVTLSDIPPNLVPKARWFSTELMKVEAMTDALVVNTSDESEEEDHSEWSAYEGTSRGGTTTCSFGYAPRGEGYGGEMGHYEMSDSEYDQEN
jgi:hypothetical protein